MYVQVLVTCNGCRCRASLWGFDFFLYYLVVRRNLENWIVAPIPMSSKRKISKEANDFKVADGDVVRNNKRLTKRPRPEELFDDDQLLGQRSLFFFAFLLTCSLIADGASDMLRRSSRTGKGSGGSIQQLQNIERIQSSRHSRQSIRNLDVATEGQEVNAMAPAHPTDAVYDDEEVPSWLESSAPLTQVRPTFTLSGPGQYGFKLSSQTRGNTERGARFNTPEFGEVPVTGRRAL